MPQETTYAPYTPLPDELMRATARTIELPIYRDYKLQVPSAGTVSLFDDAGVAVVDEQSVTVSNGVATYDIADDVIASTTELSDAWQLRWTLTMPDGNSYEYWRECSIVLRRLWPVVSGKTLLSRHTELKRWQLDGPSLQTFVDMSWNEIMLRLREDGRRPYLIMSPGHLANVHSFLSLHYYFLDASTSMADGKYRDMAKYYYERYEKAWSRMTFRYDDDEDNVIDDEDEYLGEPVLMLGRVADWKGITD